MDELEAKLKEYEELFGESFPTFNFTHLSFKEMGKIIDHCLEEGKDAYELGYASEDEDMKY